ncbi:hypothetical protein L596_010366 [Steinernema carpocapsae]|uniref:Uncharacterized protein n=1 Tax=Steinernema carpocapsae TaxID=34508 RepID=A0A4U5PI59_STECR|nr:hypothetical protein L596_010366 [Steinernema carpocapsae]
MVDSDPYSRNNVKLVAMFDETDNVFANSFKGSLLLNVTTFDRTCADLNVTAWFQRAVTHVETNPLNQTLRFPLLDAFRVSFRRHNTTECLTTPFRAEYQIDVLPNVTTSTARPTILSVAKTTTVQSTTVVSTSSSTSSLSTSSSPSIQPTPSKSSSSSTTTAQMTTSGGHISWKSPFSTASFLLATYLALLCT